MLRSQTSSSEETSACARGTGQTATAAGARKRGHAPIEASSDEQAGEGRASAGNEGGGVGWGSAQSHGSFSRSTGASAKGTTEGTQQCSRIDQSLEDGPGHPAPDGANKHGALTLIRQARSATARERHMVPPSACCCAVGVADRCDHLRRPHHCTDGVGAALCSLWTCCSPPVPRATVEDRCAITVTQAPAPQPSLPSAIESFTFRRTPTTANNTSGLCVAAARRAQLRP